MEGFIVGVQILCYWGMFNVYLCIIIVKFGYNYVDNSLSVIIGLLVNDKFK